VDCFNGIVQSNKLDNEHLASRPIHLLTGWIGQRYLSNHYVRRRDIDAKRDSIVCFHAWMVRRGVGG